MDVKKQTKLAPTKPQPQPVQQPQTVAAPEQVKRPIKSDYISMGEGKGIKLTMWDTNLQLERTERDPQSKQWNVTQKFNLAPMVLKDLFWRIPSMLEQFEELRKKQQEGNSNAVRKY